jgi:type VI secretion system VgrG family protein
MALIRDLSRAQLAFQIEGAGVDQYSVVRYRGSEGLCQLYRFEIELASSPEETILEDMVGKSAVLSINTDWGQRWFHGIVSRFEMKGETADQVYYRAELVPALWLLTHRYNSRIFQQKTTKEIISTVLTDGGIPADRFDLSLLQGGYSPREYCVQYRETDYNFICRLMEEEGIRWYFRQTQDAHLLVLADAPDSPPIEGDSSLPYVPPASMTVSAEHVFRFRKGSAVRPGAVVLRDFNFEKPQVNLECKEASGRNAGLEISDYPGEYREQGEGARIARLRTEEFDCSRTIAVGQSNSPRLTPGGKFELKEHPVATMDGEYLITTVTHEGKESTTRTTTDANGRGSVLEARVHQALLQAQRSDNALVRNVAEGVLQIASRLRVGDATARRLLTQWLYHGGQVSRDVTSAASVSGQSPLDALASPNLLDDRAASPLADFDAPTYACRFECIPADVAYRPPRITPWPVMRGSQTARVAGPAGEEIYTDKYGRVKVQFNWDREGKFDENSSCWIRVSQGIAGGQYGIMFLPRIGQEVIVDFLEGDPDQPIITGRVFNADHMPPYPLPDEKTKSCIKTNSSKGGGGTNEIRFEDLKGKEQLLIQAERNFDQRVKADAKEFVGNDRHLIVKRDQLEKVEGDKHQRVQGDRNEKVDGTVSLDVGSDLQEKVGKNHALDAGMEIHLKSGMNVVIEAGMSITLKAGGGFIVVGPAGVTISGTPVLINSGGSAGSGSGCSPDAAKEALGPDQAKPGRDKPSKGTPSPAAQVLRQAALNGTPFCEKCAEAAAAARRSGNQEAAHDE